MSKPTTKSATPAARPDMVLGTAHPSTVPGGAPSGAIKIKADGARDIHDLLTRGPALPYTPGLTIIRAPGGFIVFQAGCYDEQHPENAIGVAATPLALSVLIDDWGHKAAPPPAPEYPA